MRLSLELYNPILWKPIPNEPIAEIGTLVTNDSSRNSKAIEYVRPNKVYNNSSIASPGGFSFHPFWNIINNKQDVNETKRDRERAHEIYTPDIEDLTKQHGLLRHMLSPSNGSSHPLALLTCAANPPRIIEDGGPVKSIIQHLTSCSLCAKMTTNCWWMIELKDPVNLVV